MGRSGIGGLTDILPVDFALRLNSAATGSGFPRDGDDGPHIRFRRAKALGGPVSQPSALTRLLLPTPWSGWVRCGPGHRIRDAGILARQALPVGALGAFGHLGPCPFGTLAAFTDIGEIGRLGGVMLGRRAEAEEIGIVDHTGTRC